MINLHFNIFNWIHLVLFVQNDICVDFPSVCWWIFSGNKRSTNKYIQFILNDFIEKIGQTFFQQPLFVCFTRRHFNFFLQRSRQAIHNNRSRVVSCEDTSNLLQNIPSSETSLKISKNFNILLIFKLFGSLEIVFHSSESPLTVRQFILWTMCSKIVKIW